MSTSAKTIFQILYYNGGPDYAPNRVIGREFAKRHDLTSAIRFAARRMLTSKGEAASAHGFYVAKLKAGTTGAEIYKARTNEEVNA